MDKIYMKTEDEILKRISAINKIPSVSGDEILRARYFQELLLGYGIDAVIDPMCNVVGLIKGEKREKVILVGTGLDSYSTDLEPQITLKAISSLGISDSTALYSLAFLGELLKKEKLKNDVILVGTAQSKTRRTGINYLINNLEKNIKGYVNIEGIGLGEIKSRAMGEKTIEIRFRSFSEAKLLDINISHKVVKTLSIFLKRILEEDFAEGVDYKILDISYGKEESDMADVGTVKIEFISSSLSDIDECGKAVEELAMGASQETDIQYSIVDYGEHKGAFLRDSLLEDVFIKVCNEQNIKTSTKYTKSEISETLIKGIDSISLGIAEGYNLGRKDETLYIRSIYKGINQLYEGILKFDKS